MKRSTLALIGVAAAGALAPLATGEDPAPALEPETTGFAYRAIKNWDLLLPAEQWMSAEQGIYIDGADVEFAAERTGERKIEVDTNGDGRVDTDVKGDGGMVKLNAKLADGSRFNYAVRIRIGKNGYEYSVGSVRTGKLNGVPIRLIDQNNNGIFNEYGVDAMTVGADRGASYLSRVVELEGELFDLTVDEAGATASITPYQGETGTVDMGSQFDSRGKLIAAIIKNGDLSFNVTGTTRVPVGQYSFEYGYVEKGLETAEMAGGEMVPIAVRAGEKNTIEWGGPLVADFDYSVGAGVVTVNANLRFFGAAGEEYTRFQPDAKSPKILIMDKETGKLLDSGRFAGC